MPSCPEAHSVTPRASTAFQGNASPEPPFSSATHNDLPECSKPNLPLSVAAFYDGTTGSEPPEPLLWGLAAAQDCGGRRGRCLIGLQAGSALVRHGPVKKDSVQLLRGINLSAHDAHIILTSRAT